MEQVRDNAGYIGKNLGTFFKIFVSLHLLFHLISRRTV